MLISFEKCICFVALFRSGLINNFKMKAGKTQVQKQREKQKHELIFKYVKSFHNPQADIYLQKLRMGMKEKKESILLNSKVFEVSVMSAKHKKRVSFAENDVFHQGKAPSKNQRGNNTKNGETALEESSKDMRRYQISSPERVQSDLMQLQRSIFTTFKIKHQTQTYHQAYSSIGPSLPTKIESEKVYYSQGPGKQTNQLAQNKVVRAKSCSTISQIGLQSTIKHNKTGSMQASTLKSSDISRSLSQSSPPAFSKNSSQLSNPSSVYSQQSHNLMVQIFKQKLQSKRFP